MVFLSFSVWLLMLSCSQESDIASLVPDEPDNPSYSHLVTETINASQEDVLQEYIATLDISFVKSSCFSSLLGGFMFKYSQIISKSRCWDNCLLGEHLFEHPLHV